MKAEQKEKKQSSNYQADNSADMTKEELIESIRSKIQQTLKKQASKCRP